MDELKEIHFSYNPYSGIYSLQIDDHRGHKTFRSGSFDSNWSQCNFYREIADFFNELNFRLRDHEAHQAKIHPRDESETKSTKKKDC